MGWKEREAPREQHETRVQGGHNVTLWFTLVHLELQLQQPQLELQQQDPEHSGWEGNRRKVKSSRCEREASKAEGLGLM